MSIIKVFGKKAEILKHKKIVIIGAGGIGCTVANLIARMRVPFTIIDNDIVDDTNLERQLMFDKSDLLKPKVDVIREKLSEFTLVTSVDEKLTEKNIRNIITDDTDIVIDCTDNVESRLLLNDYCKKHKINWIYSGAVNSYGAIYFIDNKSNGPCFRCFNSEKSGESSCEIGVLNSLVALVASMTVNVAVNFLVNGIIEKDMIRIDLKNSSMIKIKVKKNKRCMCNG